MVVYSTYAPELQVPSRPDAGFVVVCSTYARLSALVETMDASGELGRELLTDAARDPALSSVMLLHDLHPLSLKERVRQALSKMEPYLRSHGGGVTLLEIREGVVHLRLEGTCNGCPSSSATLKLAVEEAVYEHAPDVAGFAVEGQPAPTGDVLVSLERGPREEPALDAWVDLPQVPHADGACCNIEVRGRSVLVCRVGELCSTYAPDRAPPCPVLPWRVTPTAGSVCRTASTVARERRGSSSVRPYLGASSRSCHGPITTVPRTHVGPSRAAILDACCALQIIDAQLLQRGREPLLRIVSMLIKMARHRR